MDIKKLKKIEREIASLRNGINNIKYKDLERLAKSLERKLVNRGKEATYESELLRKSRPLTIPKHKTIKPFTAGNIIDALEQDVFELYEFLKVKDNEN